MRVTNYLAIMATLQPSLIHRLAQAAPMPGPNPKTTQTFWAMVKFQIKTVDSFENDIEYFW